MADRLTNAALVAYQAAGTLIRPLVPLVLAARAGRGKEDAGRRSERYGRAALPRPAGPLIWVHAASVGETNAIVPLLERLTQSGFRVLFTSTTVTSSRVAAARLPEGAFHQFGPVDVVAYVDRFLDHWHPDLAILVESEVWPGAISRLHRRGIGTIIVNARLSVRTFGGWNRISAVARGLFARLSLVLAQSEDDAGRFRRLGAQNVRVTGNLKSDAPPLGADPAELGRIRDAVGQRPVWVAASTHDGEEAVVAEVHKRLRDRFPDLLTVIVPRHPERGTAVRETLAARRLSVAQRSRGEPLLREVDVYLADTLGELGLFYRLAPIAFLGGSLVPHGGQNPLEAVQLDAVVLHGPNVRNFSEVYGALDAVKASVSVTDAETLAAAVGSLLARPRAIAERAAVAAAAVLPLAGALDATMLALGPYLRGIVAAS